MDVLFTLPVRALPLSLDVPLAEAVPQLVAPSTSRAIVRGATSKGNNDDEVR